MRATGGASAPPSPVDLNDLRELADEMTGGMDALRITRLLDAYRITRRTADQATEMLFAIGSLLTEVVVGDISSQKAWGHVENILRGPPPEGDILAMDFKMRLDGVDALVTPETDNE